MHNPCNQEISNSETTVHHSLKSQFSHPQPNRNSNLPLLLRHRLRHPLCLPIHLPQQILLRVQSLSTLLARHQHLCQTMHLLLLLQLQKPLHQVKLSTIWQAASPGKVPSRTMRLEVEVDSETQGRKDLVLTIHESSMSSKETGSSSTRLLLRLLQLALP